MDSVHEVFNTVLGCGWAATAADTRVDLRYYFASPLKREVSATLAAKTSSDSGSLALKIQESATTVDSDFADITGAAFTTLTETTAASQLSETIYFAISANKKFVRSYATVVGAAAGWKAAAILSMIKRMA